jgi:branched-chain amino acid transport system permease protein
MIVVIAGVFVNLNNSRVGRAWVAIREDELAAQAMGVNTINYKLLAFAIGATLAGLAGTISGHFSTSTTPDSYNFQYSILFLGAVVLGGMGTVPGVVLGMTLLNLIPEKLRFFQDKRLFIFGLALIILMRIRPEGIVPSRRRQREFHGEASGADSSTAPVGSAVAHG